MIVESGDVIRKLACSGKELSTRPTKDALVSTVSLHWPIQQGEECSIVHPLRLSNERVVEIVDFLRYASLLFFVDTSSCFT